MSASRSEQGMSHASYTRCCTESNAFERVLTRSLGMLILSRISHCRRGNFKLEVDCS